MENHGFMKNQRIPERKLNSTKTVGQFLESMGNNQFYNIQRTETKQVCSNEGEEGEE